MQIEIAEALRLPISPIPEFRVSTGSGDKLICNRVCRNVRFTIQHVDIVVDLFLLSLSGANVILGIQWLKTLGRVVTDYNTLSMEFNDDPT